MTSEKFTGVYNGKSAHASDWHDVINRARENGVKKFLFTAGSLQEAEKALELSKGSKDFYVTVGVHPCRAAEALPDVNQIEKCVLYFDEIRKLLKEEEGKGKVVAIGECGLDYDRLEYANKEQQMTVFNQHFALANEFKLPMYLHSRAAEMDMVTQLFQNIINLPRGGVVHSFTGSMFELQTHLQLGFYIGVNGCSLKTEENCLNVQNIPAARLLLETDCPYCEIRPSHYGHQFVQTKFEKVNKKEKTDGQLMNRERNEPCKLIQVLEVASKLLNISEEELSEQVWQNTHNLFRIEDDS